MSDRLADMSDATDLIERLRALSRHEHDDLSIGAEAADALETARDSASEVLLADLRDFIGMDGIVHDEYSAKAEQLCRRITDALAGNGPVAAGAREDVLRRALQSLIDRRDFWTNVSAAGFALPGEYDTCRDILRREQRSVRST